MTHIQKATQSLGWDAWVFVESILSNPFIFLVLPSHVTKFVKSVSVLTKTVFHCTTVTALNYLRICRIPWCNILTSTSSQLSIWQVLCEVDATLLCSKTEGEYFTQSLGAKIIIDQNDGHEKFHICSGDSVGSTQDTNYDSVFLPKPCRPTTLDQQVNTHWMQHLDV